MTTPAASGAGGTVAFAPGFALSPNDTADAEALRAEAVRAAGGWAGCWAAGSGRR